MKKIKALLFALVGILALTFAIVKVSAEGELVYNADTGAGADKNAVLYDGTYIQVTAGPKALKTASGFVTAVAEDDSGLSFTKGLWTGSSTKTEATYLVSVTSKTAGAKIGLYYTISNSGFTTTANNSKAGTITFSMNESSDVTNLVHYNPENASKNKVGEVAYYCEYTFNTPQTTMRVWSSANNLVIFGIKESQGQAAETVDVTIMDGTNVLTTQTVNKNTNLAYTPVKYGFDFGGYFTDVDLTQVFDHTMSAITEAKTLYVKWNAWDSGIIESENKLTGKFLKKLGTIYNSISSETKLTGTIYSLMSGVSLGQSNNEAYVNTGGGLSNSQKGIKIVVATSGQLEVLMTHNGASQRSAKVISSTGEVQAIEGNVTWETQTTASYEKRTLKYNLNAGTYYVGGTDGMRIFSMTFTPSPSVDATFLQQEGQKGDARFVRYITIVNGIDEADLEFTLHITGENIDMNANCIIANKLINNGEVYTADVNGQPYTFDVKDGTLYIICVLGVKGGAVSGDFSGVEITATMTVNGQELPAKTYVIPTE